MKVDLIQLINMYSPEGHMMDQLGCSSLYFLYFHDNILRSPEIVFPYSNSGSSSVKVTFIAPISIKPHVLPSGAN